MYLCLSVHISTLSAIFVNIFLFFFSISVMIPVFLFYHFFCPFFFVLFSVSLSDFDSLFSSSFLSATFFWCLSALTVYPLFSAEDGLCESHVPSHHFVCNDVRAALSLTYNMTLNVTSQDSPRLRILVVRFHKSRQ